MLDENAADEKKRCIHIYIEPIKNFINDTDVLEHLFTAFGVIEKCRIHKDRKWAFIEFTHWESARLAVSFDRKLSFGPALSSGKMHCTIQIGQVHENTNLNDSKFLSPNCEFDLNSPYLTAKVESNVGPRLKFGKNPEKFISYWLRPHMTFSDIHSLFVEPRTPEERLAYRAKFEMFCCVKTIQNCMQLLLDESSKNFDYLSKPIDRADFFRTLERYLDYCPQVERIFDEKFFNTFLEFLSELDNDMNNRQKSTPIHSGFSSGFSNSDYMNTDFQHEMNRRNEFSYLGYEAEAENKIDLFKIFQQQAHQSFFENPESFERNTFGDSRQEISIHQRNQSLVSDSSTSSLFNQPFDQFNKRQEGVTSISPFENEIEGLRRQNITP